MTALRRALLVAAGAALGGLFRVVLAVFLPVAADDPALVARKGRDPSNLEAAMVVGFCGGYTSYSAFVASLHEGLTGQLAWPIGLAAATIVLCPLAAALGMRASGRGKGGYPPIPGGGAGRGPEKEPA